MKRYLPIDPKVLTAIPSFKGMAPFAAAQFPFSLFRSVWLLLATYILIPSAMATVLASNFDANSLASYDDSIGSIRISVGLGGLSLPHRSRIAPDGSLLVASANTDNLLRYDLADGSYLGVFASDGLDYPVDMIFRNDGFLYVSSQLNSQVLRFDAVTGARDLTWTASNAILNGPSGMVFDAGGNLYVSGRFSNNVVQFAADGSFLRSFGNVPSAFGMALSGGGGLLVSSGGNGTVEAFSNLNGTPIQSSWASGLNIPVGIEHDGSGGYYVTQYGASSISHFDADGNSLGSFATGTPLVGPNFITVIPEPSTAGMFLVALSLMAFCRFRRIR